MKIRLKTQKNKGKHRYALDERRKKWYYKDMENINEINQNLAKNLAYYRKASGWTQAELAEKINYSDKSVSKWESGNGVPDLYILLRLAELYGVTLNDLVGGETPEKVKVKNVEKRKLHGTHISIMLLSSCIVWLVATCLFVMLSLWTPNFPNWLMFIYAIPANAIVLIVFSAIWKYRLANFVAVSTLIWTTITALVLTLETIAAYMQADFGTLWLLFLVGIPLETLEVFWVFFRFLFKRNKDKDGQAQETEGNA